MSHWRDAVSDAHHIVVGIFGRTMTFRSPSGETFTVEALRRQLFSESTLDAPVGDTDLTVDVLAADLPEVSEGWEVEDGGAIYEVEDPEVIGPTNEIVRLRLRKLLGAP